MQIALLGDQRFSLGLLFLVLLLLSGLWGAFQTRRLSVRLGPLVPALIFSAYLGLTLVLRSVEASLPFGYILNGYIGNFAYVAALILFLAAPAFIAERRARRVMLTIALLTALLGITQYVLNSPILTTETANFKIHSWLYIGGGGAHVRGFSLFSNALSFGFFLLFALGIALAAARRSGWGRVLVVIVLGAMFCTITRNIYLGAPLALLGGLLYLRPARLRVPTLLLLPVLSFAVALTISGLDGGQGTLTDTRTLSTRTGYWRNEVKRQLLAGDTNLLLGRGVYQSEEKGVTPFLIDNTYLQMVSHIGVLGLLLYLWMYFALLRWLVQSPRSALRCGLYGFMVAWPALAMFNIVTQQFLFFALPVALTMEPMTQAAMQTQKQRTPKRRRFVLSVR